jgi:peptide-methionine (R)-S-oxide reductase
MKSHSKISFVYLFFAVVLGILVSYTIAAKNDQKKQEEIIPKKQTKKIIMDDTEWKEKLTPEQYRILRKAGTERPFGEVYSTFKKQGLGKYVCAGCDTELFSSNEKFDSKCGWPSFYDPSKAKNVKTSVDYHLGYPRTEVLCAVCDGHLGHVFTGEGFDTPTDKRYCINGTVLKFIPAESADSEVKPEKPVSPGK